jgi:hypothetical protein
MERSSPIKEMCCGAPTTPSLSATCTPNHAGLRLETTYAEKRRIAMSNEAELSDCIHVHLIKQVGPMDGGVKSTRYRCEKCSEFFYIKPATVEVRYGAPVAENTNFGRPLAEKWQMRKEEPK